MMPIQLPLLELPKEAEIDAASSLCGQRAMTACGSDGSLVFG
jgi:hypothetical protein